MATIAELTGQDAPELNLRPQHREYLQAWQVLAERAAVVRALTGVDVLDGLAPAWRADRTTLARTDRAAGKADSGPRRAHGCDDTVALTVAARAEMTDGLALSLALIGTFYGGVPSTVKCAGLRALRAIDDTESGWASTVTLMGHDTTPATDGLAGAYRWTPDTVEMTADGRAVGYLNGRPILASAGGSALPGWRAFAGRHGWTFDDSRRAAAAAADVEESQVRRAIKAIERLFELVQTGELADMPTPGRGKPQTWTIAARWAVGTGLMPADVLPAWLAGRSVYTDDDCPAYVLAWTEIHA